MKELAEQLLAGNRRALAKGITLVESTRAADRSRAADLMAASLASGRTSLRIGISGSPGVGKSTLIETLGQYLTEAGHRVAVLAVDPTSALSGGSILGDKTRMPLLSVNPKAFIRPSPAGTTLGGVTRRTRESMLLCEAAGFDVTLIETVGVGQSETAVSQMTDLFVLLLAPGGGDDLQGIKRGIMELADLVLVNKADGPQQALSQQTVADYRSALQLMRSRSAVLSPEVLACSALEGYGIDAIWACLQRFAQQLRDAQEFESRRSEQAKSWMWSETAEILLATLKSHPNVASLVPTLEAKVLQGELPATVAAQRLVDQLRLDDPN